MAIIVNREITAPYIHVGLWPGEPDTEAIPLEQALARARHLGLDLVLHGKRPHDTMPFGHIRDISQYLYNEIMATEMARLKAERASQRDSVPGRDSTEESDYILPEMDVAPADMITRWGPHRRRLAPSAAQRAAIPRASKGYLIHVGLPNETFYAFEYEFDQQQFIPLERLIAEGKQADAIAFAQTVRRLGRVPTSLRRDYYLPYAIDPAQYWILAMDHGTGTALCIDEDSGAVVIVDATGSEQAVGAGPSQYRRPQVVNASVELFGQFLYLFQLALADWGERSVTDEDVQPLERRLQRMDPAAMSDLNMGLWPTVLEDIVTLS